MPVLKINIQNRGHRANTACLANMPNRTKIIQQFLTKFPPAATRAKREHTVPLKVLPPSLCAKIARLGDSPPQLAPIQTQPATNAHRVPIILTKALLPHRLARYAKVQKYHWRLDRLSAKLAQSLVYQARQTKEKTIVHNVRLV